MVQVRHSVTKEYARLTALCPGLPRWAGTRKVKPIWILLKQETVSGSGISWAICKSAPRSRQTTTPTPHHSFFTGQMPFLPPNQQCQSTEGTQCYKGRLIEIYTWPTEWCWRSFTCCKPFQGVLLYSCAVVVAVLTDSKSHSLSVAIESQVINSDGMCLTGGSNLNILCQAIEIFWHLMDAITCGSILCCLSWVERLSR